MYGINGQVVRAEWHDRLATAEAQRLGNQVGRAVRLSRRAARLQRRAERAAARARVAIARAI